MIGDNMLKNKLNSWKDGIINTILPFVLLISIVLMNSEM